MNSLFRLKRQIKVMYTSNEDLNCTLFETTLLLKTWIRAKRKSIGYVLLLVDQLETWWSGTTGMLILSSPFILRPHFFQKLTIQRNY
jgi:hypothetical protein